MWVVIMCVELAVELTSKLAYPANNPALSCNPLKFVKKNMHIHTFFTYIHESICLFLCFCLYLVSGLFVYLFTSVVYLFTCVDWPQGFLKGLSGF